MTVTSAVGATRVASHVTGAASAPASDTSSGKISGTFLCRVGPEDHGGHRVARRRPDGPGPVRVPGVHGQGGGVDSECPVRDHQPPPVQPVLVDWRRLTVFYLRVFHYAGPHPSTRFPLWPIQLSLTKNGRTAPEPDHKPITSRYFANCQAIGPGQQKLPVDLLGSLLLKQLNSAPAEQM